jgi:hypothetical protein
MVSRRVQGANPCAEHGRSAVKSRDPVSCLLKDVNSTFGLSNQTLVDRARNLLLSTPYENPEWKNELFWFDPFPTPWEARLKSVSVRGQEHFGVQLFAKLKQVTDMRSM